MTTRKKILLAKVAVVLVAPVIIIYANVKQTNPGYAGAPGDLGPTCASSSCHSGGGQSGKVEISFPNGFTYTPGVQQSLNVTVTDATATIWGFQLTARQASATGTQAGTFQAGSDGNTQLACTDALFQTAVFGTSCGTGTPLQYVEHTSTGARKGHTGSATFQLTWTPPASSVGDIKIYVAGLAGNADGAATGDSTYTNSYTVTSQVHTPILTSGGVVNGADFQSAIAPGTWVTIQGTDLANSTRSWTGSDIVKGKLPVKLDGVSVKIDGKPAFVYFISPTQVNVLAPADTAYGSVNVEVTNNGQTGATVTATLQATSPAFFLWPGSYAVATRTDYSLVGPPDLFPSVKTTPAKPGDVIILWGTGLGPTTPDAPAGYLTPVLAQGKTYKVNSSVSVTMGGYSCEVIGAALTPGAAGLYQIAVKVPVAVAPGFQVLQVQSGDYTSPANVYFFVD